MTETTRQELEQCTGCGWYQTAFSPRIPLRRYQPPEDSSPQTTGDTRDTALLVVGESPGYQEDQAGVSWIGWSGQLLARFLDSSGLASCLDIYLTNACRCHPPSTSSSPPVNACRRHLLADIAELQSTYTRLIVLCCGAPAAKSVTAIPSLSACFGHQGSPLHSSCFFALDKPIANPYDPSKTTAVFFTYHPAVLSPDRKPALVHAIEDHFRLLVRYLSNEYVPSSLAASYTVGAAPPALAPHSKISIDIETYGILKGHNQTVFHPVKSLHIDSIPYDKQVVTVAFSYQSVSWIYLPSNPNHLELIHRWIAAIRQTSSTLIGQNIPYDLGYLRTCYPSLYRAITPASILLDDTMILSFLLNDQRPERSLKELAELFGIVSYTRFFADDPRRLAWAVSKHDPRLHVYNATDASATLILHTQLLERIAVRYGNRSPKLSTFCSQFRSQLLWIAIEMNYSGFCLSTSYIQDFHDQLTAQSKTITSSLPFQPTGTGSVKSTTDYLTIIADRTGLLSDPRTYYTEKTRRLSDSIANCNLFLSYLALDDPDHAHLTEFLRLKSINKLIDSYTSTLLANPRRGIVTTTAPSTSGGLGVCYPTWYPTPRLVSKDDTSAAYGGTIQARFSCKHPAAQTFPEPIKKAITPRFPYGLVNSYDQSQMELRTAALLSGDPVLTRAYTSIPPIDIHAQTSEEIFFDQDLTSSIDSDSRRQLAKTLNFLILYRGGAAKFQETARKDLGISFSLEFCQEVINRYNSNHPVFREWQNNLIRTVKRQGYLELPTGWSRTFALGTSAEPFINEICNFPIQTIAAQLCQSSQYAIVRDFWELGLISTIIVQVHDSILIDTISTEEAVVDQIVHRHLTRPPLLAMLEQSLGRTIPMAYKKETLSRRTMELE